MGLDMYLFSKDPEDESAESEQLHYWRKHNALHAWFEQLYYDRGGTAESFNCVPVELTLEDLDSLKADILDKKLEPKGGFFFGNTAYDPSEDIADDLEAIDKAHQAIADGKTVYYDSWW